MQINLDPGLRRDDEPPLIAAFAGMTSRL